MANNMAVEIVKEETLIHRAQTGDADAYNQLVKAYEPRMMRTALRVVHDMDDAQDAVQQAFIAAWTNLNKFRGDSQFSTWLTRITINEGISVLRRRKGNFVELDDNLCESGEYGELPVQTQASNPESSLLKSEIETLVRESLNLVKPAYREAMKLRLLEDLSIEEIAGRLDMPVNTVKVHLFRGRRAMKQFLSDRLGMAA